MLVADGYQHSTRFLFHAKAGLSLFGGLARNACFWPYEVLVVDSIFDTRFDSMFDTFLDTFFVPFGTHFSVF